MGKPDVRDLPPKCPFCSKNLEHITLKDRESHIFTCIGDGVSSPEPDTTPSPEPAPVNKYSEIQKSPEGKTRRKCSLCGLELKGSLKTRQEHLKKCSRRNKLSPASRLSLLQTERNFDSDSEPEFVEKPKSKYGHGKKFKNLARDSQSLFQLIKRYKVQKGSF